MPKFVALCAEGLEDILIEDLKQYDSRTFKKYKGLVIFNFDGDPKHLPRIKTADDILLLITTFKGITRYKKSLQSIREQTAKSDIDAALSIISQIRGFTNNYYINASYVGRRDYKSGEIEGAVQDGILKNHVWEPGEELLFRPILRPDVSLLGISILDVPLHIKNRLLETVPGSIKSSIAVSLLKIANANPEDTLLDPMCGSGIIPIEAQDIVREAMGIDIDENIINSANINAGEKDVNVKFIKGDSTKIKLGEKVTKIVSNLPFDKQVKVKDVDKFFSKLLEHMVDVTTEQAVFVFLTRQPKILIKETKKHELKKDKELKIKYSGIDAVILKFSKNN